MLTWKGEKEKGEKEKGEKEKRKRKEKKNKEKSLRTAWDKVSLIQVVIAEVPFAGWFYLYRSNWSIDKYMW